MKLPRQYQVQKIPAGAKPDELLIKGELDAVILTSHFASFARGTPNVRRLFENYQEVEAAYFKKTSIFPIMHTVAMREDLWREHPWIATSLYKAFQKSKQMAYERLNDLSPYKLSMVYGLGNPWRSSGRFWEKIPGATVLRETAIPWRRLSAISVSRR